MSFLSSSFTFTLTSAHPLSILDLDFQDISSHFDQLEKSQLLQLAQEYRLADNHPPLTGKIIGLYDTFSVSVGLGGALDVQRVKFRGVVVETGQIVEAWVYGIGIEASANALSFLDLGSGYFSFNGEVSDFGGPSLDRGQYIYLANADRQ